MKNKELIKKIGLVVAVLVVLFFLWTFVLYPHQTFKHNEKILSEAGKRYFSINRRNLPKEEGRVSTVSLEVLIKQKYLDDLKIGNSVCNIKNSNVKLRVESGADSYYTHLQCGSRHSNVDYQGPVITLNGKKKMTINLGDSITDPGILSIKDKTDGEIKVSEATVTGKVNTSKIGKYKITYEAADSLGNTTTVTREVEVISSLSKAVSNATKNSNGYYQGEYIDNYISFNNILFRIVKVNKDNSVTIVSDTPLANIDYGAAKGRFNNSSMDEWLNNYFYNLLNKKSKDLIVDSKWCDDVITNENVSKTSCDRYSKATKVGILSVEDYNNSYDSNKRTYLNIMARTWYNNFTNDNKVWSIKSSTADAYDDNVLLNIKPAVTLSSKTRITGGTGASDDPYLIGTESKIKRGERVNKLDIGAKVSYSGYTWVVASKLDDGTTEVIMDDNLRTGLEGFNNIATIAYEIQSPSKIYNPKEVGNIGYKISNELSKYIDTSYFVNHEIDVPIYDGKVTYKGKHETKTYKTRLSVPSVFEIFSGKSNSIIGTYWLIESSKESENKTLIEMDGTTPFYYKETGKTAGVRLRAYLNKNVYVKSDDCTNDICKIRK